MLAEAQGFVFDLDGTLIRRTAAGPQPLPGAREVLAEVRRSGRPLVVFTNASHVDPSTIAASLRERGLAVSDREVLTPICSAIGLLARARTAKATYAFVTSQTRQRLLAHGVELLPDNAAKQAEVVLVAHADSIELDLLEAAATAVRNGAQLLTANYAPAYASGDGIVLSRAAMITAAIARAAQKRPAVVGKPSVAAVREFASRLGVPATKTVVVGDDLGMDVALGHIARAHTVLVRTGISAEIDTVALPASRRPDDVIETIAELPRLR